jgi:hypothetical protein
MMVYKPTTELITGIISPFVRKTTQTVHDGRFPAGIRKEHLSD